MRVRHDALHLVHHAARNPRFGPNHLVLPLHNSGQCVLLKICCRHSLRGAYRHYTSLSGRFADALLADAIYCLLTLYTVLVDAAQDSLSGLPTLHKILCLRTLSIVC